MSIDTILAIDPGSTESAYVVIDDNRRPLSFDKVANYDLLGHSPHGAPSPGSSPAASAATPITCPASSAAPAPRSTYSTAGTSSQAVAPPQPPSRTGPGKGTS